MKKFTHGTQCRTIGMKQKINKQHASIKQLVFSVLLCTGIAVLLFCLCYIGG